MLSIGGLESNGYSQERSREVTHDGRHAGTGVCFRVIVKTHHQCAVRMRGNVLGEERGESRVVRVRNGGYLTKHQLSRHILLMRQFSQLALVIKL